MTPPFDPSLYGVFLFGLVAGICPCNSVLCIGLIGYLTRGEEPLPFGKVFTLVMAFCLGTVTVLIPLGAIAGYVGSYTLLFNSTVAWGIGGVLMIAMGLQLLHVYKPPIRSIYNAFKRQRSTTVAGVFLIGLSFGAITVGRGAPMLLVVLTYIALYETPAQGLVTMGVYAVGLSMPLIVIGSVGGTLGRRIKDASRMTGDQADRLIGAALLAIGAYFLYLAAS